MKSYILESTVINGVRYSYFFKREKSDVNGNSRYRVWIIDPDGGVVYEKIVKAYGAYDIRVCIEGVINNE